MPNAYFESVKIIASGKDWFWDAVNIATAAFPIAKGAAKLIGLRLRFTVSRPTEPAFPASRSGFLERKVQLVSSCPDFS